MNKRDMLNSLASGQNTPSNTNKRDALNNLLSYTQNAYEENKKKLPSRPTLPQSQTKPDYSVINGTEIYTGPLLTPKDIEKNMNPLQKVGNAIKNGASKVGELTKAGVASAGLTLGYGMSDNEKQHIYNQIVGNTPYITPENTPKDQKIASGIGQLVGYGAQGVIGSPIGSKAAQAVSKAPVLGSKLAQYAITQGLPGTVMAGTLAGVQGKKPIEAAKIGLENGAMNIAGSAFLSGVGKIGGKALEAGKKVLDKVMPKKPVPVEVKKPLALPEAKPSEFAKQVDDWKNGKLPSGTRITIGNTPQSLRNVGAKNHDLIMNQKTLKKLLSSGEDVYHGHELDTNMVKDLPNQYEKPVMVMESEQNPNSLVVLTDKFDKENNPVISVIKLNENDGVKDINRVATAYGKKDIDSFIGKHIQQNKLLDIDNKKSQDWLLSRGLQSPKAMANLDSGKIIPQDLENVNTNLKDNLDNPLDEVAATKQATQSARDIADKYSNIVDSHWEYADRPYDTIGSNIRDALEYKLKGKSDVVLSPKIIEKYNDTLSQYPDIVKQAENEFNSLKVHNEIASTKAPTITTPLDDVINNVDDVPFSPKQTGKYTDGNNVERGFSQNVRTDNNMETDIRKSFDENPAMYEQLSNTKTQSKAETRYNSKPLLDNYNDLMTSEGFDPSDVVLGRMVANEYAKQGNIEMSRQTISRIAEKLTQAGQFSQSAKILRDADPETFNIFLQKQVNKLNKEGLAKYGKKWADIQLTDNELKAITDLGTAQGEAKDQIMEGIYNRIAEQIPTSTLEKLNTVRRMAMLLNPKTHIRNLTGNALMGGLLKADDVVNQVFELGFKKENKTRDILWRKNKELVGLAEQTWESAKQDLSKVGGKYDIEGINLKHLGQDKKIFKSDILNKINDFSGKALEAGDIPFMKSAYIDNLGQYMSAKGLNNVTDEAKNFAMDRAMEATYKQMNAVTDALRSIKRKGGILGGAFETVIPFDKTPINIFNSTLEHSPIGYIKVLFDSLSGKTGNNARNLAKATTGTGLGLIGFYLATLGLARTEKSKSQNAEAVMSQAGEQPYSISTPFGSYTFDWAQPSSGSLAFGISLGNEIMKNNSIDIGSVSKAFAEGGDTIFNISVFKSFQNLFSQGGSVTSKLAGLPIQFLEQMFPVGLGQVAKTVDPIKRNLNGNNPIAQQVNVIKSKTPFLSKTLPPSLDSLGREQYNGNAFQQFLSPGYYKPKSNDKVDIAVAKLYKQTKDTSILPKVAPTSITYKKKDYKLSPQEVTDFQRKMGQENYKDIKNLVSRPNYDNLDDNKKVKLMKDIVDQNYEDFKKFYLRQKTK